MTQPQGQSWIVAYDGYDPAMEGNREALCTLANGYFGTRGAWPGSSADDVHYPGTYIAGVYDRTWNTIEGQPVELESIINAPNWLPLAWRIDDESWFDLDRATILEYRQELDLRQGILVRRFRVEDATARRTQLIERRFVHMQDYHLAGLELTLQAENWSGTVEIRSGIDGTITNSLLEYDRSLDNDHLQPLGSGATADGDIWLRMQTRQSRIEISVAARTRILRNGSPVETDFQTDQDERAIGQHMAVTVASGDTIAIEKITAVFTSRDPAISESEHAARQAIARAPDFAKLLESHIDTWDVIWQRCNIDLNDGDETTQLIVRLHLFHLLQTVSSHTRDLDVGTLARGLTGEAYYGHIFWDEIFVLPFLNFHFPDVSRALLRYRYLRLGEARFLAQEAGYRGAMFPWRSGSSGREETPPYYANTRDSTWIPDHTHLQRHVGAAVAYNVWHYYEVTRDRDFLITEGAEMLLEIARFWASSATFNNDLARYEIHGVMGPDEFHTTYPWNDDPGLSNNTYTNMMAVWTIRAALDVLAQLPAWRRDELRQALTIDDAELERWHDVARRMRLVFLDSGELAQFEGYDRLQELDWEAYRKKYGDLQRIDLILNAEGDSPNNYKLAKQPDVLMLFYLFTDEELESLVQSLGYDLGSHARKDTIEYYLNRNTGGSTLSRVVQAEVFAGTDRSRSWQCLQEALQSDVGDIQGGSTATGIHIGAMGGTIEIIERRYTGIDARGDALRFNPALPDELQRLSMRLYYRNCRLDVTLTHRRLRIETASVTPETITIALNDRHQELTPETPIDWEW
jgi:alpha,alpha-trehalase